MPTAAGTKQNPWNLKTPPGTSEFQAWRDEGANPPALVVQVGKTELRYQLRCLEDLHAMLKGHGDWMRYCRSACSPTAISRRSPSSSR